MPEESRFLGRVGLDRDFFEPYKIAHHAVEAPIEEVSLALANAGQFFSLEGGRRLRVDRDVFGQACGEDPPLVTIFQLRGQTWTQFATDIRWVRALPLGQFLSRELGTRCICIEVTDDAYQSHALFENGDTDELYLFTMNVGMKPALSALGLDVPAEFKNLDRDDLDQLDEAEYNYRREGTPGRDASELVRRAGCFLKTPSFVDGRHGVSGLRAEDIVGMDVIWIDGT